MTCEAGDLNSMDKSEFKEALTFHIRRGVALKDSVDAGDGSVLQEYRQETERDVQLLGTYIRRFGPSALMEWVLELKQLLEVETYE